MIKCSLSSKLERDCRQRSERTRPVGEVGNKAFSLGGSSSAWRHLDTSWRIHSVSVSKRTYVQNQINTGHPGCILTSHRSIRPQLPDQGVADRNLVERELGSEWFGIICSCTESPDYNRVNDVQQLVFACYHERSTLHGTLVRPIIHGKVVIRSIFQELSHRAPEDATHRRVAPFQQSPNNGIIRSSCDCGFTKVFGIVGIDEQMLKHNCLKEDNRIIHSV